MNFGTVHGKFVTLRQRLIVRVGPNAIADINVQPPPSVNDELSFLRLISWAYALVYEAGRVSLKFLKNLPPFQDANDPLPYIRPLRTWVSHNLSLEKTQDIATIQQAIVWFQKTCNAGTPATAAHWALCINEICTDLSLLLDRAIAACDALDSKDDGDRLVEGLKLRLSRDWDAYRFDQFVVNVTQQLGYSGIDAVAFRGFHLTAWRRVVATADEQEIEKLLLLRIQADVLKLMADALPVQAQEILQLLKLNTSAQVVAAMLLIQRNSAVIKIPELLDLVAQQLNLPLEVGAQSISSDALNPSSGPT